MSQHSQMNEKNTDKLLGKRTLRSPTDDHLENSEESQIASEDNEEEEEIVNTKAKKSILMTEQEMQKAF